MKFFKDDLTNSINQTLLIGLVKEDWAIGKIGLIKSDKCPDFVMLESALKGDCRFICFILQ